MLYGRLPAMHSQLCLILFQPLEDRFPSFDGQPAVFPFPSGTSFLNDRFQGHIVHPAVDHGIILFLRHFSRTKVYSVLIAFQPVLKRGTRVCRQSELLSGYAGISEYSFAA